MGNSAAIPAEQLHERHSTRANLLFWLKSRVLIVRRMLKSAVAGEYFHRHSRMSILPASTQMLAADEHRLYSISDPRERELELGKVQNLRVAAAAIDGIVLEPGELFSFWRAARRPSRSNGLLPGARCAAAAWSHPSAAASAS